MIEFIFILWVAVGTAGFWETIEGMRRIREFKFIPESIWSVIGAIIPVFWITLIQIYLHPLNILAYGVISIIYMIIVKTRRWEIWSSMVSILIQLVMFFSVPIWHAQGDHFWAIFVAQLVALGLYFIKKSPLWALLVIVVWIVVTIAIHHTGVPFNDLIYLLTLTVLLYLYTKESARRLTVIYERGHDPLTHLMNRISFNDWMQDHTDVMGTMVLIDLDDFKFANDTFGHQVGDQILEEVGRRLRRLVGVEVFRWGGDEFIILLPDATMKEQAAPLIEQIHEEITKDPFVGRETLSIQASMGLACGVINDELLSKADNALLQIKRTGKNRIGWYVDAEKNSKGRVEVTSESHLKWVSDSLRYLMEHSTKGFILTNLKHQILDVNPVFEKMSGYSREKLLGKSPKMLASPLHLNQMKYPEMKETLQKLDWWNGTFINKRPNGEVWMSHDEISAVKVGKQTVGYWALVEEDQLFDMEHELLYAMDRQEFHVFLQPKCTENGNIIGAEALMRWLHADRGFISPMEFIPVAENNGLIIPMGYWVFREVCVLAKRLEALDIPIPLSINLSPLQFHDDGLVEHITQIIKDTNVNPRRLTLEVTEGILIDHPEEAIAKLECLHELGLQISLDDFGTGYSSLAYLKDLNLDELKIDQSFIRSMGQNESSQIILSSLLSMAFQLHLQVVAEGVETSEQLEFLIQNGCQNFQGFYFSQPIPAETFFASLRPMVNPHVRMLK